MNFLGVGPGELILILIIALVVVGPERLPGLARQLGRMLVRVRNWMQTSPDAALVLRARQELEQELAQLRSSLLEVQNVRDEVIGVAKQIDQAVSPIASIRPPSFSDLIKEPADKPQPRTDNGLPDAEPAAAADDMPPTDQPDPALVLDDPSDTSTVTEIAALHDAADGVQPAPAPAPLSASDREELGLRIQALMADLNALQEQLRQRGLLDADWQPPSWAMHLPGPLPETPIEEADT